MSATLTESGGHYYHSGDVVRLNGVANDAYDACTATIVALADWGVVCTIKTSPGPPVQPGSQYRAGWDEVVGLAEKPEPRPKLGDRPAQRLGKSAGYEIEDCDGCGFQTLRRNGACLVCDTCGKTTGCS